MDLEKFELSKGLVEKILNHMATTQVYSVAAPIISEIQRELQGQVKAPIQKPPEPKDKKE